MATDERSQHQRCTRLWMLAALAVVALLWPSVVSWQALHHQAALRQSLANLQGFSRAQLVDCASFVQAHPLVLLILGQSNAANHGPDVTDPATPKMRMVHGGECAWVGEPLAVGTGNGANLWVRLPSALREAGSQRPVVLVLLAVDASTVADWTAPSGPLRSALQHQLAGLPSSGLQPDFVLWQQGESDVRLGTPPSRYARQLQELADHLGQAGIRAPILLARSTLCRSAPAVAIRQAIMDLIRADERFVAGPDTDALDAAWARHDGCHFSIAGMNAAAKLWAQALALALAQPPSARKPLPLAGPARSAPV